MSAGLYGLAGGANRQIKKLYANVGGVNREIKELWAVKDGVNRKIFQRGLLVDMASVAYSVTGSGWSAASVSITAESDGLHVSGTLRHSAHGSSGDNEDGNIQINIPFPLGATKSVTSGATAFSVSQAIPISVTNGNGVTFYVYLLDGGAFLQQNLDSSLPAGNFAAGSSRSGTTLRLVFVFYGTCPSDSGLGIPFSFMLPNEVLSVAFDRENFTPLFFS